LMKANAGLSLNFSPVERIQQSGWPIQLTRVLQIELVLAIQIRLQAALGKYEVAC